MGKITIGLPNWLISVHLNFGTYHNNKKKVDSPFPITSQGLLPHIFRDASHKSQNCLKMSLERALLILLYSTNFFEIKALSVKCDLIWGNREQVACDIWLVLGVSTDQQCMAFMVNHNHLSIVLICQGHAITECQSKPTFPSGLVAWLNR